MPRLSLRSRAHLAFAASVAIGACRTPAPILYQVEPTPAVVGCAPGGCARADEQVEITYLGVSGFLVRYRGAALLTAPFFTNPPIGAVSPTARLRTWGRQRHRVRPDTLLIERLLPREADDASMIVVGHAHYDHLLDVPYVARMRATHATIVGSPTMRHLLMGDPALRRVPSRVVALSGDTVGTVDHAGRWITSDDGRFRVMPLRADHAPTLWTGYRYANGTIDRDRDTLPVWADDWKVGEPLSYVIDVLEPGSARIRLRLYYQDAPSTPPLGFPPASVLAEHGVDVALLCGATASNVRGGAVPDSLLAVLRPRYALVGHWESFFRPQTLPLAVGPEMNADAFLAALTRRMPLGAGWQMPVPRTVVRVDLR